MKKIVILMIITLMVIIGCDGTGDSGKLPGQFAVQADNSRSVMARNVASLGPYNINTARTIYFYLKNIGDYPITDIELSLGKHGSDFEPISNNDFAVFPTKINTLVSSKTSSVDTFIELNVNHGHIIGSIAQSNVINKDVNGVMVRITGKTTDGEKDIPVSLDVNVDMLINVASFNIVYGDDNTIAEWGYIPYYYSNSFKIPPSEITKVRLHNSGNVNLHILGSSGGWHLGSSFETTNTWEEVLPNAYSNNFSSVDGQYFFILDTKGVVFNNKGINELVYRHGTSIIQFRYTESQATPIPVLDIR